MHLAGTTNPETQKTLLKLLYIDWNMNDPDHFERRTLQYDSQHGHQSDPPCGTVADSNISQEQNEFVREQRDLSIKTNFKKRI